MDFLPVKTKKFYLSQDPLMLALIMWKSKDKY